MNLMNIKCFTGRTSREAMALVRHAYGEDAVILSTKPGAAGVQILAMAPETAASLEQVQASPAALQAAAQAEPEADAEQLAMSTLSFQDYVRERMHRRKKAAPAPVASQPAPAPARKAAAPSRPAVRTAAAAAPEPVASTAPIAPAVPAAPAASSNTQDSMMHELQAMKQLITQNLGALAFTGKLQQSPQHARLAQRLLNSGFSAALIRKLMAHMPAQEPHPMQWASGVLVRNLRTGMDAAALEDQGGIYAMVGATGVGKTSAVAKLAAACARRHGAASVGLVTLDTYRLGAHEQLRAYGNILGIPVHMAHDQTALRDLLGLLSAKKMVLIDTVGCAHPAQHTPGVLDMLGHPDIRKLLVLNAAAQAESNDSILQSYRAEQCQGVVLSKTDEAVKLAPALDALIRHRTPVLAVANGQRVPEDWHRLPAVSLVQTALQHESRGAHALDLDDASLVFTMPAENRA